MSNDKRRRAVKPEIDLQLPAAEIEGQNDDLAKAKYYDDLAPQHRATAQTIHRRSELKLT